MTDWRAVVFDIEGVIARQDVPAADRALAVLRPGLTHADLEAARHSARLYPLWIEYSRGELRPEAYWSGILAELGVSPTPAAVQAIRDIQSTTWWSSIDLGVLAIARRLHERGILLATLSNSAPEHEGQVAAFADLFDVMHFSHLTGRRKPDADAYLALLAELGTAPGETLFVDDKRRNVAAARRLGIAAVLYRSCEQLETAMARLGIPGMSHGAD